MYFKLEMTLRDLTIRSRESVPICIDDCTSIELRVDPDSPYYPRPFSVIITKETTPPANIESMFRSLHANKMPNGSRKLDHSFGDDIDNEGNVKAGYIPPLSIMPDQFTSFVRELNHEMNSLSKRAIGLIRWINGVSVGLHNPFSVADDSWSLDGLDWRRMPHSMAAVPMPRPWIQVNDDLLSNIPSLLSSGMQEPLGHELYKEAWGQRHANPRSALIMCVAAVEVGLKQCIGTLLPETQWLMEYSPSPPVAKMLKNYLPAIPARCKINDRVLPPPRSIMSLIVEAIEERNKMVHIGGRIPDRDRLENMLLAACDLLWLLDFYCGFEGALTYMRPDTRQALEAK